ncbi:14869_t:CDS:2 [Cetraspora pellucida]|uniref:14869_t:CDS:1 n=1 Tax=Cetraspora pellucida TaxID=1433469 RepID=A0A9N9C4I1_9GLOM|nr:14869_t:CDS:2 [Cetraspora pellucida]
MIKKQKYNKKYTTSKPPLRNFERNNLFEDESQVMNVEITENKRKRISSHTNVKKKNENEEPSLMDSDNGDSRSCSCISKNIQPQSEQASNASSNESSPSIRSYLPENFYDQCSLTSTLINLALSMINADGQESVITRGKVDRFNMLLESDLGTLQMHLKCLFFRTRVINKQIIDMLMRSLFPDVQHAGASECAALQRWVFGCYRDYNASLRQECSQNTVSQASLVLINRDDSSESLQENFSDNESLQKNFFDSKSLQENFSNNESLQGSFFERSQHNDFECNSSVVLDTSSGSDQLSIIEDIGLQTEENFNEIIVDSRIDF